MPTEEIDITGIMKGLAPIESLVSNIQPPETPQTATETITAAESEAAPATTPAPTTEGVSVITLEHLLAVDAALKQDTCQSIEDITKSTGLPETTVARCIEFLVDHGLVAKSAMVYCGINAVEKLISQLRVIK